MMFKGVHENCMLIACFSILCVFFTSGDVTPNVTVSSVPRDEGHRIVGGSVTNIRAYPYVASLQMTDGRHKCGGTVLAAMWILTAAHCGYDFVDNSPTVTPIRNLRILVGSSTVGRNNRGARSQLRSVAAYYIHERYNHFNMLNDIGIIQVNKRIYIDGWIVGKVKIPASVYTSVDPPASGDCIAVGWGYTSPQSKTMEDVNTTTNGQGVSPVLRQVNLALYSISQCQMKLFSAAIEPYYNLCTYGGERDACRGDSGGPLMCNGEQWGITSWGEGCAQNNTPGAWTRVDKYLVWIRRMMNKPLVKRSTSLFGHRVSNITLSLLTCIVLVS